MGYEKHKVKQIYYFSKYEELAISDKTIKNSSNQPFDIKSSELSDRLQ